MTLVELTKLVVTVGALVRDPHGWAFGPGARGRLAEGAAGVAEACQGATWGEQRCVVLLVVMGAWESGWTLGAVGDGGRARGVWQEWYGVEGGWAAQARHYMGTVARAMRVCPEHPISALAGERCGGDVAVRREKEMARVVGLLGR